MSDFTQFTSIVRELSREKFVELLDASPRQARETFFSRHGVRLPKMRGRRPPKPGEKRAIRAAGLFEALQQTQDDELCEELLRNWLLTKREMLAAALDHLGIEHNHGLTQSDELEKVGELSAADLAELAKAIEDVATAADIAIYLKFLGAKNVDAALGLDMPAEAGQ